MDATEALLEAGEDPSIRAIAEKVGCTPPSIYLHWSGKDALLREVAARGVEDFERLARAHLSEIEDPLECLRAIGAGYVRFGLERPDGYKTLIPVGPVPLETTTSRGAAALLDHIRAGIDRCIDEDALVADPWRATVMLWSGLHGLTSLLLSFPDLDDEGAEVLIDQMLDVLIEGLLAS